MPFHRHRNSQKRIYVEGATYFITSVTDNRIIHFREPILCELFIEDLWFARELKVIDLHGYTVIPEHFHLQITPSEKSDYSQIMGTIKRNVARDINDMIGGRPFIRNTTDPAAGDDSTAPAGDDSTVPAGDDSTVPAGDDSTAPASDDSTAPAGDDSNRRPRMQRLWANYHKTRQEHPHLTFDVYATHFERLRALKGLLQARYPKTTPLPRFKWQKSFHDHIIRNERDYFNHLNYIYYNAVKHGLVDYPEDWPFMWIEGMPESRGST